MDIESKLSLIKQVGEEIITEKELKLLLKQTQIQLPMTALNRPEPTFILHKAS